MPRTNYIVGNWKMNHNVEDLCAFMLGLEKGFEKSPELLSKIKTHQAWIAPQAIHLTKAQELLPAGLKVGAQNCGPADSGAFTGDISPKSLKDIGAHFVILGHSERRSIFKEDAALLERKLKAAISNGLKPIFCIGETKEERESGNMEAILRDQLLGSLKSLSKDEQNALIIAYEPVWAIGTGLTATTEQAESAHAFVRQVLLNELNFDAASISILYGGSVKPDNIAALMSQENIDGALVGGASLKAQDYLDLLRNA